MYLDKQLQQHGYLIVMQLIVGKTQIHVWYVSVKFVMNKQNYCRDMAFPPDCFFYAV